MYKRIGDYGIIGDLRTVALIGNDGSIDWLCLPCMDSPSIFAALLDEEKGGRFSVSPADPWDSTAAYIPGTNILTTTFRTRTGEMKLTDFMPLSEETGIALEEGRPEIYRLIEITHGELRAQVTFTPRPDYARAVAVVEHTGGAIVAGGAGMEVVLCGTRMDIEVRDDRAKAVWDLLTLTFSMCLTVG